MAMTESLLRPASGGPWTLADLQWLPGDELRYEIHDGSLLVSPPPALPHFRITTHMREILAAAAPHDLVVGENVGVAVDRDPRRTTMLVPDLTLLYRAAMTRQDRALRPEEVVAVVEVLSLDSAGHDQVTKRHLYAQAGIRHYWIADPSQRVLTVLRHNGTGYDEVAAVKPGTAWSTEEPFLVTLDPADFS
jgi:Uma2 family endonuclease